jgi:hypothetical protein
MAPNEINSLISGALLFGYSVAALFFFRFWARTRDRLFVWFASAFGLLAIQRLALALASLETEDASAFYAIRLLAFVIILIAIIDKNRGGLRRRRHS